MEIKLLRKVKLPLQNIKIVVWKKSLDCKLIQPNQDFLEREISWIDPSNKDYILP